MSHSLSSIGQRFNRCRGEDGSSVCSGFVDIGGTYFYESMSATDGLVGQDDSRPGAATGARNNCKPWREPVY